MSAVTDLFRTYSSSGRKLRSREYTQAKRIAQHRISSIKDKIEHVETHEHPRQLAFQKQSMFGRGLGKSTIYQQESDRLKSIQSRQMAALDRELQIANAGLSLIRRRRRNERRMTNLMITSGIISAGMTAATVGLAASGQGGMPSGGGGGTSWGGGNTGPVATTNQISYGATSSNYYYT